MGGPARPLHEPGNHRSSERCSHRHSADCGSLIERPTLLRITAPTPRPGARSNPIDIAVLGLLHDHPVRMIEANGTAGFEIVHPELRAGLALFRGAERGET